MGDTLITADVDFEPAGNAILAFDTRSGEECGRLIDQLGYETIFNATGMPAHTMNTATKIAWVIAARDTGEKIPARFMCTEDFVIARLTGRPVMSWSTAARTMMFDTMSKQWWPAMLDRLGLGIERLSEIRPSGSAVGKISARAAGETGLSGRIIVATGGHDQICSAVGSGAVGDGIVSDNTGTFECVIVGVGAQRRKRVDTKILADNKLALYPHGPDGLWAAFAWFNAGSIVQWCRDTMFTAEVEEAARSGKDVFDMMFSRLNEGSGGVQALPHFTGAGTPWLDPRARGVLAGLELGTDRYDILRAVVQGIGYDLLFNIKSFEESGIDIREIRATGGGSRSPEWVQLKADMTGREVKVVAMTEASALGAAICAGAAAGRFVSIEEGAGRMVALGKTFIPDMGKHEQYRDLIGRHFALYSAVLKCREGWIDPER